MHGVESIDFRLPLHFFLIDPYPCANFRKTFDGGRGGEGGGIDYASFSSMRAMRSRKRYHHHYGGADRHWDRYGYPDRQRHVRPRYNNNNIPPPPPLDEAPLKPDLTTQLSIPDVKTSKLAF